MEEKGPQEQRPCCCGFFYNNILYVHFLKERKKLLGNALKLLMLSVTAALQMYTTLRTCSLHTGSNQQKFRRMECTCHCVPFCINWENRVRPFFLMNQIDYLLINMSADTGMIAVLKVLVGCEIPILHLSFKNIKRQKD